MGRNKSDRRVRLRILMIAAGAAAGAIAGRKIVKKLRQDWNKAKVEQYFGCKKINFAALVKVLHNEFAELVKKKEEQGAFDEDKKTDLEGWRKFYEELKNM